MTADAAYQEAGYKPSRPHASRLATNGNVVSRVAEMQERVAEKAVIDQSRVLEELVRIGLADPRAVMSWGPYGLTLRPSEELTVAEAALVSEVAQTKDGMRLKMHSKLDALQKLGQHLGMFKERVEHSGTLTLEGLVAASFGNAGVQDTPEMPGKTGKTAPKG